MKVENQTIAPGITLIIQRVGLTVFMITVDIVTDNRETLRIKLDFSERIRIENENDGSYIPFIDFRYAINKMKQIFEFYKDQKKRLNEVEEMIEHLQKTKGDNYTLENLIMERDNLRKL